MRSCGAQNKLLSPRLLARPSSRPASSARSPSGACRPAKITHGFHSSASELKSVSTGLAMKARYGGDGYRPEGTKEYESLDGIKVWLTSTQKQVNVTEMWKDDERQEHARQLNNDVLPKLRDAGVKLYFVSIGPPERGIKFNDLTGMPKENILGDPENETYKALGFKNDTISAFFSPETPKALWRRIREDGAADLKKILTRWPKEGFFVPPKNEQAKQQGGTVVFDGKKTVWRFDDPATSAHATPKQILEESLRGV